MTPLLQLVAWTTVLTFVAILAGAVFRNREWTLEGMKLALGNRDNLPAASPLGDRAVRAATNAQESFILFVPLDLTAHAVGADDAALVDPDRNALAPQLLGNHEDAVAVLRGVADADVV